MARAAALQLSYPTPPVVFYPPVSALAWCENALARATVGAAGAAPLLVPDTLVLNEGAQYTSSLLVAGSAGSSGPEQATVAPGDAQASSDKDPTRGSGTLSAIAGGGRAQGRLHVWAYQADGTAGRS